MNNKKVLQCALILAGMVSFHALLYSYLRGFILLPWLSFAMGGVTGSQQIKIFRSYPFMFVYAATVLFFSYYAILGVMRTHDVYGSKRLSLVSLLKEQSMQGTIDVSDQNIMVRRSTINKQSQIFNLVARNGFYNGKTMSYFVYVFIPRIIWPEKPIIARGQWFARQLGMGQSIGRGRYAFSNAINMTIPGELYLNFGWAGVMIGCTAVGFLLMTIWYSTLFWGSISNITGMFLSFQLIYRSISYLGPDMQSIVGYISTYIIFWGGSIVLRSIFKQAAGPGFSGKGIEAG
jgi:hypothetical protein